MILSMNMDVCCNQQLINLEASARLVSIADVQPISRGLFLQSKICTKCGIDKPIDEYYKYKNYYHGKYKICMNTECMERHYKKYPNARKAKLGKIKKCLICGRNFKTKVANHILCSKKCRIKYKIDYNKKYHDEYYQNNTNYVKEKVKDYRLNNKEKYNEQSRKYYKNNKDKINFYLREYKKDKQSKDKNYYFRRLLTRRVFMALTKQNGKKAFKTIELLGCTIEAAKRYIEKQFKLGMNWENHSRTGWHIDHIIPCASFDLTDPEQQKICFHYTNLQPLWAIDNIRKGSKIII